MLLRSFNPSFFFSSRTAWRALSTVDSKQFDCDWGMAGHLPEIVTAKKCFEQGLYNLAVPPLRRALEILLQHARDDAGFRAASLANQMLICCYQKHGRFACVQQCCTQPSFSSSSSSACDLPEAYFLNRRSILLHALLRQHQWLPSLELIGTLFPSNSSSSSTSNSTTTTTTTSSSSSSPLVLPSPLYFPSSALLPSELLVTKALVHQRLDDLPAAHDALLRALDSGAEHGARLQALLALGRVEEAEREFQGRDSASRILRAKAVKAWRWGHDVAEAERLFNEALEGGEEEGEEVAWTLYELGRMYHEKSRHILAEGLYTRVIEMFVGMQLHFDAHYVQQTLAQLLATLGQHSKAANLAALSVERINAVDRCL